MYYALKTGSDEREKFYRELGETIFRPRFTTAEQVTIKCLGAGQEVGRSCLLVETSESKVLLDAGISSGREEQLGRIPAARLGRRPPQRASTRSSSATRTSTTWASCRRSSSSATTGPVYCTEPTLPLMTLLQNDFIKIAQIEGGRILYDQKDIRDLIQHTITLQYGTVTDVSPGHQARPQQRGAHPGLRDGPPPHRRGGPQHRLHGRLQVRPDAALRLGQLELPEGRDADHRGHLRQQGGHHATARGGGDELRQRHQQHARRGREGAHPDPGGGQGAGDNPGPRPLHEEQGPHRGARLPGGDDLRGHRDPRLLRRLPLEGAQEQDTRAGHQPVRQRILHLHRAPVQAGTRR